MNELSRELEDALSVVEKEISNERSQRVPGSCARCGNFIMLPASDPQNEGMHICAKCATFFIGEHQEKGELVPEFLYYYANQD